MKILTWVLSLILVLGVTYGQTPPKKVNRRFIPKNMEISNLIAPRAVRLYNKNLYILNGHPTRPSGGSLTIVSNKETQQIFQRELSQPRSFQFVNNRVIIVADQSEIKLLNIHTQTLITKLNIPAVTEFWDIVLINPKIALASDPYSGGIYKISIDLPNKTLSAMKIQGIDKPGVTGIHYDNLEKKLYFVTSYFGTGTLGGMIYEAVLENQYTKGYLIPWNVPRIGTGNLYALNGLSNKRLAIVDRGENGMDNGAIYTYHLRTKDYVSTLENTNNAGDFAALGPNSIVFPDEKENTLYRVDIPRRQITEMDRINRLFEYF